MHTFTLILYLVKLSDKGRNFSIYIACELLPGYVKIHMLRVDIAILNYIINNKIGKDIQGYAVN